MDKIESFQSSLRMVCPFCGGKVDAGYGGQHNAPMVIHTLPYCKEFDELEPDRFLESARIRLSQ
jgi:hypothetical protein